MAYKFEDKFVHFRWDDSLKGKNVFYANSIDCLENDVDKGEDYRLLLGASEVENFPFHIKKGGEVGTNWKFVYYDPNYEVKLAYEEGKQIQYRAKGTGNWCDWDNSLCRCPFLDDVEYRIKSEVNAYVSLNRTEGTPRLLWTFDEGEESRHIYFRGTPKGCCDYIESHNKFAPVMKAWEDGEEVEFMYKDGCTWLSAGSPTWTETNKYRVKPKVLEWTDLNVGDIIEICSVEHRKAVVTEIDFKDGWERHIHAGSRWLSDTDLKNWRKVKNV